jgi:hypothetical protein
VQQFLVSRSEVGRSGAEITNTHWRAYHEGHEGFRNIYC